MFFYSGPRWRTFFRHSHMGLIIPPDYSAYTELGMVGPFLATRAFIVSVTQLWFHTHPVSSHQLTEFVAPDS